MNHLVFQVRITAVAYSSKCFFKFVLGEIVAPSVIWVFTEWILNQRAEMHRSEDLTYLLNQISVSVFTFWQCYFSFVLVDKWF